MNFKNPCNLGKTFEMVVNFQMRVNSPYDSHCSDVIHRWTNGNDGRVEQERWTGLGHAHASLVVKKENDQERL